MARPSTTISLVKSHLTNAEKAVRIEAENGTLTGMPMKPDECVKSSKEATKEFKRIKELFRLINKDDDLYSKAICGLCMIYADITQISRLIEIGYQENDDKIELLINRRIKLYDMALRIEKESLMTLMGALRSIPKKAEKEEVNPMKEFIEAQGG